MSEDSFLKKGDFVLFQGKRVEVQTLEWVEERGKTLVMFKLLQPELGALDNFIVGEFEGRPTKKSLSLN